MNNHIPDAVFVTYIVTTPEKLWEALTSGDFTEQYYFGRRIDSDWKAGSPWKLLMDDGRIDSEGEVLESEPLRRLALTWRVVWLKEFVPEGKVQFEIEPLGNVVRLTVSEFHHRNLDEKFKEGGRKGWPILLSGLKTLL